MSARVFLLFLLVSFQAFSQTPSVGPIGDEEDFAGSQVCVDAPLLNAGPPGFGPYLQLIVPIGVTFDSASIFMTGATVTNVGAFPAPPGNQLQDSIIDAPVTGPEGFQLILVQPPIGSLVAGAPPLNLELCFTIDADADVGVPLDISVTPIYELGDSATGENGPITGSPDTFSLTPILVIFDKTNTAPEQERPPGPSWPVTYTLNTDVADGATLDNVVIADTLPADFVLDVASIMIAGGVNCAAGPGPNISVTCDSVTGTANADDLVVTYRGYFDDVLDEASCDARPEMNSATLDADFDSNPIPQESDFNIIELSNLLIQKSVDTSDTPPDPDLVNPGETITYTLDLQLTDFGTSDSLILTDILPDGISFGAHTSLTIGGAAVAIVPTVTPGVPAAGQTTVVYDLTAVAGNIAPGSAIQLVYTATVNTVFDAGNAVLANDSLTNNVTTAFTLDAGASGCSNPSSSTVLVSPVVPTKTVVSTGPYSPGDAVIYRLSMVIPSGDTRSVVFTDFFPLPVFDVNDIDLTFGVDIVHSPSVDTLGLTPDSITIDGTTNSLIIEWPDVTTGMVQTISVDVSVSITTDPFADNLNLSNLLQVDSLNSPGATATGVVPALIEISAPDLTITKGVVSADQGTIDPPAATLPVDGNVEDVDAGDDVTFQLTIENLGGAQAFDVFVSDPVIAGLTGCTVDSVEDGAGATLITTAAPALDPGFIITTPLAANDDAPMGGGAPYADDTAIVTYTCVVDNDVEPNSVIENTASVTWASAVGGVAFPAEEDTAEVITDEPGVVKNRTDTAPDPDGNDATVTIGETIEYTVVITIPEGESLNTELVDTLDSGLVFQSFDSIIASPGLSTDHAGGFPGVLTDATGIGGPTASFPFDNITNSNTANGTAETITSVYIVLVEDVVSNENGDNLGNFAGFAFDGGNATDEAPNTLITEPVVTIDKSVSPITADAGDTVTYTVELSNSGTSDAFNVEMTDLLADPNLTLVTTPTGTVTTTQGTVTTGNTAGDTTVVVDVGTIPFSPATTVTVTFQVLVGNGVSSGQMIPNTASATYESLPSGGRVYDPVEAMENLEIGAAEITKVVLPATSSEQTGGTSGQGNAGLVDLTIGEEVTFRIQATLAEGVSPSVIITDTLPGGATGLMEVVSSTVVSIGGQLSPTNTLTTGTTGPANVEVFDFGSVTNFPDGVVNDDDRIIVEVTAIVVDDGVNSGLEVLTNNVMIQYAAGLNESGSADIEVVEPRLGIDKSSPTTTADAGDTITYTIVITNDATTNSSANAFDVAFTDVIPAGLTFAGNLSLDAGLAPDATTLVESGGTVSAFWTQFDFGQSATISFDVTVDGTVAPEELITNTANVAWGSLPGADPEEREDSSDESHDVTITAPGLTKIVFDTSEPGTMTGVNGPEDDIAVGELVTYRFTITFPEGTSPGAVAFDQLPTVTTILEAQVTGTEIISVGANLTVPGGGVGTAGVLSNTDADAYNDLVTWNLGDVVNMADGLSNADDQIVFQVNAVLVDEPVNQNGLNDIVNTASFTSGGNTTIGTALIDVVGPDVEVTKETVPMSITADAGDVITYRITVDHTGTSTSDAFNFTVTDALPDPGTSWINDSTVAGTCTGVTTDSSGDPSIEFTFDVLTLATDSCTIEYQVMVDVGVNPNETYQNTVTATWTSTSAIGPETRTGTDMDDSTFVTPDPAIIKTAESANTSLADTGDNVGDMLVPDMAIGELIDFNITVIFPEGTTTNALVVDQLPLIGSGGVMEMVNATVATIGGNITTTLPGTAVIANTDADAFDDQATLDFGTVTNTPDGVDNADDHIIITVTARVVDVPENADLDLLTNTATFTYGAGEILDDTADIEVVVPELGLTKAMGPMADGVVPITLTFSNTGNAPAYDILIEDILDTGIWDVSTITGVTIPTGFVFADAAGPGATEHTVSISSDPAGSTPATSIEPAEVIVFTFSVALRDDVVLPTTIPNTATVTEASTIPGDDPAELDLPEVDADATLEIPVLDSTKSATLVDDLNMSGGASPGEVLEYTIVLTNSGDGPANNVTITDTPDMNGTIVLGSVSTTLGTITSGNTGETVVSVDVPTLAAGTSVTIIYRVTINDPLPAGIDELVNQGLIESDELPDSVTDDPDTGDEDDETIVPIDGAPDLTIAKDDGGITASAGVSVVYTLTYANVGTQDATGVEITETVPANTTFDPANSTAGWACLPDNTAGSVCTLAIGNVAAGDPAVDVDFAVMIDLPLADGVTEINNAVSIADDGSNGPDPTPGDNDDTDDTPISDTPDFQITKDDGGVTAVPGGDVVFMINYSNTGGQNATGVVITETVPANTVFNPGLSTAGWACVPDNNPGSTCTLAIGALAGNGASGTADFAVTIDNPLASGVTSIMNTVSIADDGGNGADPTPGNNTNDDDTPINAAPDFVISKSDGGVSSGPGQTVVYTINYDNVGNQNATGVVITETVPANTTFDAGMSAAGWACVPDGNAGSVCTFAVGALNVGGGSAVDFAIIIDDPLPTNVKSIVNTVSITDDGTNGMDPNPGDNTGGDNTPVGAVPDLTITKDDGGITATAGSTIPYAINYANIGNQQSTGIMITETVPLYTEFNAGASSAGWVCIPDNTAGSTCTLAVGSLNGGGDSGTATFAVDVLATLPATVVSITNSISIGDDGDNGADADPNNNNDDDDTPVDAAPDMSVTKVDQSDFVNAGGTVTYEISYANVGTQDATGVVITETVPANTTFAFGSSSPGWNCLPDATAGSTCTFNVGPVAAGAPAVVIGFAVVLDNPLPAGFDTVINNVSINDDGTNGPDPDPNNDTDDETTNVGAFPDLSIAKTDGDVTSGPGQTIVYTLDYANEGDQNSTGVVITETVPANTTFNPGVSTAGWVCTPDNSAGSICDYTVGALDAGDSGRITFAIDVDDPLALGVNLVVNNVSIEDDGTNGPDSDPNNNDDTDDTSLQLEPPVGLKIGEFDADNPRLIHWTIWWFNPNNDRDLPVFVFDDIPEGTIFYNGESCVAEGTSTCTTPVYNAALDRIELTAILGEDQGAPADSLPEDLNNEIVIRFDTFVVDNGMLSIANQAQANWDEDNDGDPINDADDGQGPIPTDDPVTAQGGDPTVLGRTYSVPTLQWWSLMLLMLATLCVVKPYIVPKKM